MAETSDVSGGRQSAIVLTDDEWNMLRAICGDWLIAPNEPSWPEAEALARRIIAAVEAGENI